MMAHERQSIMSMVLLVLVAYQAGGIIGGASSNSYKIPAADWQLEINRSGVIFGQGRILH